MPKRLPISPKEKASIFKLYAKGLPPSDIVATLRDVNLTATQISNLVSREGWAKRRMEIAEVKERSAKEVLEQARASMVDDLGMMLELGNESLKTDAEKLRNGWQYVSDAAGASSMQRAKSLHLDRMLRFHGLEAQQDDKGPGLNSLAVIFARPEPIQVQEVGPEIPTDVVKPAIRVSAETPSENASGDLDFAE